MYSKLGLNCLVKNNIYTEINKQDIEWINKNVKIYCKNHSIETILK